MRLKYTFSICLNSSGCHQGKALYPHEFLDSTWPSLSLPDSRAMIFSVFLGSHVIVCVKNYVKKIVCVKKRQKLHYFTWKIASLDISYCHPIHPIKFENENSITRWSILWCYPQYKNEKYCDVIQSTNMKKKRWKDKFLTNEKTSWIWFCFSWLANDFVPIGYGWLKHTMRWNELYLRL